MLDLTGLPKNVHGVRTTHTCELCGFEPKTKNKYREKQDHLVMKHFKEKIDKIFPHCRPYACPAEECQFTGKDKQALLRHYTGKHGILEKYLREALAEKGINYTPSEGGKRRHSEVNGNNNKNSNQKNPRLSLTPPGNLLPVSPEEVTAAGLQLTSVTSKPVTLPQRPNTEELRKEVEAMMRSFQPVEQPNITCNGHQINGTTNNNPNSINNLINGTTTNGTSNGSTNGTSPPPIIIPTSVNGGTIANSLLCTTSATNGHNNSTTIVQNSPSAPSNITTSSVVPTTALPSIVLSAVANATAASVAAKAAAAAAAASNNTTINNNNNNQSCNNTTNSVSSINLPTQPANVPTITITSNGNMNGLKGSLVGPSASSLPLPIEVISNGTVEAILPDLKSTGSSASSSSPSPISILVENEDVMWSAASQQQQNGQGHIGPAVVVEAAHSLPIAYIDSIDAATFAATAATIENATIDFDYLYPATTVAPSDVRERQLEFSML